MWREHEAGFLRRDYREHLFDRSRLERRLRFVVLVPAIVLIFGLVAAVSITVIGVQQLGQQSDAAAALRARLLAETLAERLSDADLSERVEIIERAVTRSGAELVLVNAQGQVLIDGSIKPPPPPRVAQLLIVRAGETQTSLGRRRPKGRDARRGRHPGSRPRPCAC